MNAIQVLGKNFFKPLAKKDNKIFLDCINIVFQTCDNELSFGIDRKIIIEKLKEYFDGKENAEIVDEYNEDSSSFRTAKEKAIIVLNRMKKCNWVESNKDIDGKTTICLTSNAITITKALNSIAENREVEYEASVSTIAAILKSEKAYDKPYEFVIKEVFRITEEIIDGLKRLNTNIKGYIDVLTKNKGEKEIIANIYTYYSSIGSKAFMRIHTNDNISIYREQIIQKLKWIRDNAEMMQKATNGCQNIEYISDKEEAREYVAHMIASIIDMFESSYDEIMREIEYKHDRYLKSSIARVKFLMSNHDSVKGRVSHVLQVLVDEANKNDNSEELSELCNALVSVHSNNFIEEESLSPAKTSVKKENVNDIQDYSVKRSEIIKNSSTKKMLNRGSNRNVRKSNGYALRLLNEKNEIKVSDTGLSTKDDIIDIIYISMHSSDENREYDILRNPNAPYVEAGGCVFKDFEILKRR